MRLEISAMISQSGLASPHGLSKTEQRAGAQADRNIKVLETVKKRLAVSLPVYQLLRLKGHEAIAEGGLLRL